MASGSFGVALQLHGVSRHFGALRAINEVTLEVAAGERRAVIGPNGAGKTTLFHVISGMIPSTSGRIEMFGKDVSHLAMHRRIALGLSRTFQITNLFTNMSVRDNLVLALQGLSPSKFSMFRPLATYEPMLLRAERLLEEWQLAGRRGALVKELSYGEQRTLEILLGVAQNPKLLLLDEPTAGLSPAETALAVELIHRLPRTMAVLLIEHDMDVALQLCDSLTVLHLGEVLANGSKNEVRQDPRVQKIYLGDLEEVH
jgi:branched-chain amino acid transport system ATP-binding protein